MAGIAFDLQPMSIGDLLDRSVRLYRQYFLHVVGIGAPPNLLLLLVLGALKSAGVGEVTSGFVIFGVAFLAVNVGLAALARSISERYLGRAPGIRECYTHVLRKLHSLLWVLFLYLVIWGGLPAVAVALSVVAAGRMGLPQPTGWDIGFFIAAVLIAAIVFIAGVVVSVLAFFRLSLATEILVIEGVRGRKNLRRSWKLMRRNTGRAIVILFFWFVVSFIAGFVLQLPFRVLGGSGATPTILVFSSIMDSLAGVLTTPFLAIPYILLYFDSRIRLEGFDLEMMARDLGAAAAPAGAVALPRVAPLAPASGREERASGEPRMTAAPAVAAGPPAAPVPMASVSPPSSVEPPPAHPSAVPKAPVGAFKICPQCQTQVPLVRPTCPKCGARVPFRPA